LHINLLRVIATLTVFQTLFIGLNQDESHTLKMGLTKVVEHTLILSNKIVSVRERVPNISPRLIPQYLFL
jgi:hypothetical protein